jgi:HEAT repeat protein
MDSDREVIRSAGAKALGYIKTGEAKKWLVGLTEYGQPEEVRRAAMETLIGNWPGDDDVRTLLEALVLDKSGTIRRKAVQGLGLLGCNESRRMIESIAETNPDALLRKEARRTVVLIDRFDGARSPQ